MYVFLIGYHPKPIIDVLPQPVETSEPPTIKPKDPQMDSGCQQINLPEICSREGLLDYKSVSFPNPYTQTLKEAGELFTRYLEHALECPLYDATIWLCMAIFPACPSSQGRPMCRHFCEGVESTCSKFGRELGDLVDCSIYPDNDCISFKGCKYSDNVIVK